MPEPTGMLKLPGTVNVTPFEVSPFTVTTTFPVVAVVGTTATIDVLLQLDTEAVAPLNFTVLEPCVAPKFEPVIVTDVPIAPDVGDTALIVGEANTVNATPLETTPLTVTTTFPVLAPDGTAATIEAALQLDTVAATPLNFTVLVPCVAPKFVPVIVTAVPATPEVGDTLLILGVGSTVNATPVLANPFTVTTILPLDAPAGTTTTIDVLLQLEAVSAVPLSVTVLVPCVAPKFVPVIVTDVPTGPDVGERLLMEAVDAIVAELDPLMDGVNRIVYPVPVSTTGIAPCHPVAGHPKLPPGDDRYAIPPLNDWFTPGAT